MVSTKRIKLQHFADGTPFIVPGLENEYKCLYLVRAGDSTCKVQGYKKTEAGNYTGFSDFFSPATEVMQDKTRRFLSINKDGQLSIPKEYIPEKENEDDKKEKKVKAFKISYESMETENNNTAIADTNEEINTAKRGAGRPRKHSISLPHGEEFTVNQLAEKLGVKKFVINNEISKIKKVNPDILQIVGTIPQGKGKPAKVFKLI
jgi:hypothetical protein